MAGDRVQHLLRIAAPAQLLQRHPRVTGLQVGKALEVEVVHQSGHRPELLVLALPACVGAHRRLHAQHVLSERVGGDPLADQLPGVLTRRPGHAVVGYPSHRSMEKFVIQGGTPLPGEIVAAGNKNAALPILAACLLTEEELVLTNVPRISDTETQVALLESLGVSAAWTGDNELRLQADAVGDTEVDEELAARIRASFLLAGPLLARFGEARMPPPGGDFIGRRRLDPHLDAFARHGRPGRRATRWIEISAPDGGLKPCAIFMDEPSVMATENALMAASLTPGPTTIGNAACEPHVQDLARLLTKMGAQIDGIGSNVMTVHGRDKLGGAEHRICPDHIEVASFMALAAATKGELRVRDARPDDLTMIRRQFRRLGLQSDGRGRRRPGPAGAAPAGPGRPRRRDRRRSTTGPGRPSPPT